MKRNKFKIILALVLIGFFLVVILISGFKKKGDNGSDYKIGILADDGVAMVSISKERQMINYLSLSDEAQVWIPGGMGWYRNQVIKKVLMQEKKVNLIKDVLFFNFGFVADKTVVLNKTGDWQQKFWWQLFRNNNLIRKNEKIEKDIDKSEAFLDKIMLRDFSETKVVNDDIKLSVVNSSSVDGLGGFVTKQLERSGFTVISLTDGEGLDNCKVLYGNGVDKTFSWRVIKGMFDCDYSQDSSINEGEIEIYLGKNFSEVIKYPTYKK
ncbi:MAG: LytR C-terminal domain-containing protein [Candidatus Shapirobacteria bacterium]|nr:LytR C-terminal domain-containing protein [Candidatus Shapirobacteria bacterium]